MDGGAGITSILNYAPTILSVPEAVSLRKVDLAVELQILSFYQQRKTADGQRPVVSVEATGSASSGSAARRGLRSRPRSPSGIAGRSTIV